MIFKLIVIFHSFLILDFVLSRGIRSDKENFFVSDGYTGVPNGAGAESSLLAEKVKSVEEEGVSMDSTHYSVDQESIGNAKRRNFGNGRSNIFQPVNSTADYVQGSENDTWNVEKKEKTIDVGKEIIMPPTPCQVTTEELVATAQATVTRALKGLCNAKKMEERFEDLENSILNQLNTIKTIILSLEDRLGDHDDAVIFGQRQLSVAVNKCCHGGVNGIGGSSSSNSDLNNKNQKINEYSNTKSRPTISGVNPGHIHHLEEEEGDGGEEVTGPRDPEILKFNSSIHMETTLNSPPRKVFTYYWKIKDMKYKLTGWNSRKSLRSQSFYIFPSGYRMYMRVFSRQKEDNFYVRVGLTKGEFDDNLKWPFPLKHKIHILDQTKEGRLFEDIASRIWDPNLLCSDFNWQKPIKGDNHECVEIAFPHDVLRQREYIRSDALVIKLTVYLES